MAPISALIACAFLVARFAQSLPYLDGYQEWNLNQNKTAGTPLDYWGEWDNHTFTPSPSNWRMPFYSLFLDRFVDGDPSNNDINGTLFEVDSFSTQLRAGGDLAGLVDTLDYLQGMGIRALYISGSPFINLPWSSDSFSPVDLTLLDQHFGTLATWRAAIDEIHSRGMYIVLENTFATMGDLLGFEGYLNQTTPFSFSEHNAIWKSSRRYWDFDLGEDAVDCQPPRFWDQDGRRIGDNVTAHLTRCRSSDFDQYGDVESFGVYPEWQKQLSKFGFVQDRLREWRPSVLDKIKHFSCMAVASLDIDGFRIDKALTVTVDAQADWSAHVRSCARSVGKNNFFIPGEVVGGNALGSLYYGRGKEPGMAVATVEASFTATNTSDPSLYIRAESALDSACFHYSAYRALTRFLGIDGVYGAEMDTRTNWAEGWQDMLLTNDMVNINTGRFDPRHMFGVSNQDVFRWPAIQNGTDKFLLGTYVMSLLLPGIPIISWGEEQAFYVLDNLAGNYLYGRQPMSSSMAWQQHGCYKVGSEKYFNFPLDGALYGCQDPNVGLDHRDPSHPVRGIIKRFLELRTVYPVLNDGFDMLQLSNHTHWIYLPGSGGTGTELGLWSNVRLPHFPLQNFSSLPHGDTPLWFVFGNEDGVKDHTFNCSSAGTSLAAPYSPGMTVKNLLYPYDEYTLQSSARNLTGTSDAAGCLDTLSSFPAWGFKLFVPKTQWAAPAPTITRFLPGHDYRFETSGNNSTSVNIEFHFSTQMNCDSVAASLEVATNSVNGTVARIDKSSIRCWNLDPSEDDSAARLVGQVPSVFAFAATVTEMPDGIHQFTIRNATAEGGAATGTVDRFLLRVGTKSNPMVFPTYANYSQEMVYSSGGDLYVRHQATGATQFRCSRTWGSSWTAWQNYTGKDTTIEPAEWSGTSLQAWNGEHVICEYYSKLAGSSHHRQEGDLDPHTPMRRFPHLFINGPWNSYGFDAGIQNQMRQTGNSSFSIDLMAEWPTAVQYNVWGLNPDGQPDQTFIFGDVDSDRVLDRLPPATLAQNVVNVTASPPAPYTGWRFEVDDSSMRYTITPVGSRGRQIAIFVVLLILPILAGCLVVFFFTASFYKVKHNVLGVPRQRRLTEKLRGLMDVESHGAGGLITPPLARNLSRPSTPVMEIGQRQKVLIATMEYNIEDWAIKVKIGGLGVMAQLMGQALHHLDIVWVVPCVGGGIEYPIDQLAPPMEITIFGELYTVNTQYHVLRNITYVLLDAPIFRQQTPANPYPERMDDLPSAIYYSAWNQCIASALKRFSPDIYHINDFHGAVAPLYLLPRTIPVCLSLHNAEFQGMWSLATKEEKDEVCQIFNLDQKVVERFVQFGEVFNLLHAGASYLREFQHRFGAVGVSRKYGRRSYARYPIFWGLSKIGSLPNPDPSDTGDWSPKSDGELAMESYAIDAAFEAGRSELRRQAQAWAGLDQQADADLFVFVGRWSMQKGVDLIADVMAGVLEQNPKVQLIAVGPVIDLYGRLAAIKLERLAQQFPGRVFSKPEFTQLPPFVFSGAEFALIPSRDEPFGLVAVEFGRKGALGIGARVGGLGNMPGWYYTVESTSAKHLISQFKDAIHRALASDTITRAKMRAASAKQRFPVARWVTEIEQLYGTAISQSTISHSRPAHRRLFSFGQGSESMGSSNEEVGLNGSTLSPAAPIIDRADRQPPRPPRDTVSHSESGLTGPIVTGHTSQLSVASIDAITKGRTDFALQQVDPFFTDEGGEFTEQFRKKLAQLDAKNSENELCIETHLIRSEKKFFNIYKSAKQGLGSRSSSNTSLADSAVTPASPASTRATTISTPNASPKTPGANTLVLSSSTASCLDSPHEKEEMPPVATPPSPVPNPFDGARITTTPLQRFMLRKLHDWSIYSLILALGQILAANSYQITLLNGEQGQTAIMLYIICSIYAGASVFWWLCFRTLRSVWVLSLPFSVYGIAFVVVGCAPFAHSFVLRGWLQTIGTGLYAAASASGFMYFALNFGDEGKFMACFVCGAPVRTWVIRACAVQGIQQIYIAGLWYWGSLVAGYTSNGIPVARASDLVVSCVCLLIAIALLVMAGVTFHGLPDYYHQTPGSIPSFFTSILRRKLVMCFFASVFIQNFWISSVYGRNWRFLWTSAHVPAWQILLLVILFFGLVWLALFLQLARLSREHSWIFPMLAIGLGAPRWAQVLWGVSGIATTLPWAGPTGGAILARALWLWLGVLDAMQGAGIGMTLLQTLTRFHNCFALVAAQVLGSAATAVARAVAPDKTGPGPVFPNLALSLEGLGNGYFWACLLMQLGIAVAFGTFFRSEQLSKP
ncbi:hypothetical protein JCM24511_06611 [Saitozyma sp. JCM 24511]|nr:hypothetical protein JCM24511_06611 [Saitozyma sp. JCM 24511]